MARAHSAAAVKGRGMASGQRVVRSMMVRRRVQLLEVGRGPTRSMWRLKKTARGIEVVVDVVEYFVLLRSEMTMRGSSRWDRGPWEEGEKN